MTRKVWLGGEGPSEIGDSDKPADSRQRQGALEALLRRVRDEGLQVCGATRWKDLRNYQAGKGRTNTGHADERNVQKLALVAKEKGCEVVAFSRDRDSDKEREAAIEAGLAEAAKLFPSLRIAGGVAKPALEGWILALLGERGTDELSRTRAEEKLAAHGYAAKRAEAYVEIIESADVSHAQSSASLSNWLGRASAALEK